MGPGKQQQVPDDDPVYMRALRGLGGAAKEMVLPSGLTEDPQNVRGGGLPARLVEAFDVGGQVNQMAQTVKVDPVSEEAFRAYGTAAMILAPLAPKGVRMAREATGGARLAHAGERGSVLLPGGAPQAEAAVAPGVAAEGSGAGAKPVTMSAMMDKNGNVYTGKFHSGIVDELADQIGHKAVSELKPFEPGFVDTEGNFLTREQALESAKKHGQIDVEAGKRLREELNLPEVERPTKVWAEEIYEPGTFPTEAPKPPAPTAPSKIPAGGGFVWGVKPIENIQGISKSGVMPENRFAKAGSEAGAFSNDELQLMRQMVPEAFTETGVNVSKLHEGLGRSGPVVEVKKLGALETTPEHQRLVQVEHELDTRLPEWREGWGPEVQPDEPTLGLLREQTDLQETILSGGARSSSAQYGFVGPKPENQMPGYVEGLVRLPNKSAYEGRRDAPAGSYVGPHFGQEDINVLSSYRGYEETLPSGEKAFHVIEVQSDWGQARREAVAREPTQTNFGERLKDTRATDHPLLQHYETLGLKAAIQHAKEIGATKVILPDAETAMMTEGHDSLRNMGHQPVSGAQPVKVSAPYTYNWHTPEPKGWTPKPEIGMHIVANPEGQLFELNAVRAHERPENVTAANIGNKSPGSGIVDAEVWAVPVERVISQEKGMRLHYDQTLPSAMRKLTGDKGQPMDLGTHKAAEKPTGLATDEYLERLGSPVFKDAAGKPKTNITGKIYDISKTPDKFKLMEAWDKIRAAEHPSV